MCASYQKGARGFDIAWNGALFGINFFDQGVQKGVAYQKRVKRF